MAVAVGVLFPLLLLLRVDSLAIEWEDVVFVFNALLPLHADPRACESERVVCFVLLPLLFDAGCPRTNAQREKIRIKGKFAEKYVKFLSFSKMFVLK